MIDWSHNTRGLKETALKSHSLIVAGLIAAVWIAPAPVGAQQFKRPVVTHWDVDCATKEATDLRLVSPKLKQFAIDYGQVRKQ